MQDDPEADAYETRNRWAMGVAFALIVSPVVMLAFFLLIRTVESGKAEDWFLLIAVVWFLISDNFIGKSVKRFTQRFGLRWMTPKRVRRVSEALVLAPIFAFCLIRSDASLWQGVSDYALGLVLLLLVLPIGGEIWDAFSAFNMRRRKNAAS